MRAWPNRMATRDGYGTRDNVVWLAMEGLSWAAETVPWDVWRLSAGGVATVAMAFGWRRAVLSNVRHVGTGDNGSLVRAAAIGRREIATHLLTLVSAIRGIDHLAGSDISVEGWENVQPLIGRRGIVVVAPHCGSYPVLGMVMLNRLRELGFNGRFATMLRLFKPLGSHAVMDWFQERLESQDVTVIPTDAPPATVARRLVSTLHRGGIAVLFVDEPSESASLPVAFFDAQIQMPVGPVRLARASGAVIVPCCATFEPGERHHLRIGQPIEPSESDESTLAAIAKAFEPVVARNLEQWSMLTPIWERRQESGTSLADLHLHTRSSDGLLEVADWVEAMPEHDVKVIAITDHDHLATVARAKRREIEDSPSIIPGVEITARGRVVHVGVLFPDQLPTGLIPPGRPISEVVRWARQVPGSIVVLVHPLPILWRYQLWRLRRDGLLPDAMEIAFPLAGWRSRRLEQAAVELNVARLGGSDGHLSTGQLGSFATRFPGSTVDDLIEAIRCRTTEPVYPEVKSSDAKIPTRVYVHQFAYSWLYPFRRRPAIQRVRQRLLGRIGQPHNTCERTQRRAVPRGSE